MDTLIQCVVFLHNPLGVRQWLPGSLDHLPLGSTSLNRYGCFFPFIQKILLKSVLAH